MKNLLKNSMVLVIAVLFCVSLFAGCQTTTEKEEPKPAETTQQEEVSSEEVEGEVDVEGKYPKYKLAAAIPITGNLMQYGEVYKNSIEMAVNEFNEKGGLGGKEVELVFFDDKSDQKEAVNVANKIIEDDEIFATIGSFGSALTMAAAPTYQDGGMVLMSPNTSHKDFHLVGNLMISYSVPTTVDVTAMAETVYNDCGAPNCCLIYQGTELGVTFSEVFTEHYTELGGNIMMGEMFIAGETKDFTPILSKFKAADAEAVIINCEYQDQATIMIQADQIGLDCQFVSAGQCVKAEFLDLVGKDKNGVSNAEGLITVASSPCFEDSVVKTHYADNELVLNYINNYHEQYPGAPMDTFGSFAYDGANMCLYAALEVGTADANALADAIRAIPCELTSSEGIEYLEDGSCFKTPIRLTIKNNEWHMYGE